MDKGRRWPIGWTASVALALVLVSVFAWTGTAVVELFRGSIEPIWISAAVSGVLVFALIVAETLVQCRQEFRARIHLIELRAASHGTNAEVRSAFAEDRAEVWRKRTLEAQALVHELAGTLESFDASWSSISESRTSIAVDKVKFVYVKREARRWKMTRAIRAAARGHILYRFFDDDAALIYVGITRDIQRRARQHELGKDWWRDVASVRLEYFQTRFELEEAERLAVIAERPRENITYSRAVRT